MELDLDLEGDAEMDVYFELLTLYLLVDSALGECELSHRMSVALDSGETERMAAELRHFEAQPEDVRARIVEGDPTLSTLMESHSAPTDAPRRKSRPASA